MQLVEQNRRIDVALMVRAVDRSAVDRNVLCASDALTSAKFEEILGAPDMGGGVLDDLRRYRLPDQRLS